MAENLQENEFKVFGFLSKQLRSGFLIAVVVILLVTIMVLFKLLLDKQDALVLSEAQKQALTEKLYNKMLDRVDQKVNEKLDEPVKMINESVRKVNNSANKVDSVADSAGELTRSIKHKLKNK